MIPEISEFSAFMSISAGVDPACRAMKAGL